MGYDRSASGDPDSQGFGGTAQGGGTLRGFGVADSYNDHNTLSGDAQAVIDNMRRQMADAGYTNAQINSEISAYMGRKDYAGMGPVEGFRAGMNLWNDSQMTVNTRDLGLPFSKDIPLQQMVGSQVMGGGLMYPAAGALLGAAGAIGGQYPGPVDDAGNPLGTEYSDPDHASGSYQYPKQGHTDPYGNLYTSAQQQQQGEQALQQAVQQQVSSLPGMGSLGQYLSGMGISSDPAGAVYRNKLTGQTAPLGARLTPQDMTSTILGGMMKQGEQPVGSDALINSAYAQQFGRAPDQEGFNYWKSQLDSGALAPDQLGQAIADAGKNWEVDSSLKSGFTPLDTGRFLGGNYGG